MGFLSGGNSKRVTNNTTRNFNTSFGIGGDNNGIGISGDNNTVTMTDYEAIRESMDVVRYSLDASVSSFDSMSSTLSNVASEAFLAVGDANAGANQLSEMALSTVDNAMQSNQSIAETSILASTESNQTIANLASEFGGNLSYLTDSSITGNQALTETSLNNSAMLINQFGSDMLAMSENNSELARESIIGNQNLADTVANLSADLSFQSMNNNAQLVSQFGFDLNQAYSSYSADLANVTDNALNNNAQLVSQFGYVMDNANERTAQALTDMAVLQERGLDNALQVAGSVSMNDNSEASSKMVMYISIGLGIIGVGMILKK